MHSAGEQAGKSLKAYKLEPILCKSLRTFEMWIFERFYVTLTCKRVRVFLIRDTTQTLYVGTNKKHRNLQIFEDFYGFSRVFQFYKTPLEYTKSYLALVFELYFFLIGGRRRRMYSGKTN